MKFRRNKKGFTMVELIIVIAVIAVLTAILVPTFIHLANKAGDASDKTIVKNANTQLALKAAQGRRNTSMSEAVKDVDEIGYHMSGVSTSNGNQICWDRLNDRFVLFNKDNQIILADGERTQPTTAEEFADFFKPVSNFADAGQFTPYAKSDFNFGDSGVSLSEGTLTLGAKSFDVGELEGVTTVNVEDTSATGTYLVGTGNTSVKVNVNVPNGTVYHLGIAGEVSITGIKGDSYHEFGRIGFAEMASNGRYVAEKGAEVKALWFSNASAKYTKESGTTVNEYAPDTTIKAAIEAQLTNDDVIVSGDHDGVKSDAIKAITEEINKEEGVTPSKPVGNPINNFTDLQAAFTNGGVYYLNASFDITEQVSAHQDLTIDLNGKTLSVNIDHKTTDQCAMAIYGPATLIFKDGVGTGSVLNIRNVDNDTVFGFYSQQAVFQIDGGTYLAENTHDCLFGGLSNGGIFRINGGSIYGYCNYLTGFPTAPTVYMNQVMNLEFYLDTAIMVPMTVTTENDSIRVYQDPSSTSQNLIYRAVPK